VKNISATRPSHKTAARSACKAFQSSLGKYVMTVVELKNVNEGRNCPIDVEAKPSVVLARLSDHTGNSPVVD